MDLERLLTIREVDHRDPAEMARWQAARLDALREALGWDGLLGAALSSRDRRPEAMTHCGVPPVAEHSVDSGDNSGPAR